MVELASQELLGSGEVTSAVEALREVVENIKGQAEPYGDIRKTYMYVQLLPCTIVVSLLFTLVYLRLF